MAASDEPTRLDRQFDALLFGDAPPIHALDPALTATLVELRTLGAAPPPESSFVARLERDLIEAATRLDAAKLPAEATRERGGHSASRAPLRPVILRTRAPALFAWVATAALLALTLAVGIGASHLGFTLRHDDEPPLRDVRSGANAPQCDVQPRDVVPAPPRTGSESRIQPSSGSEEPEVLDAWDLSALQADAQPADAATATSITELIGDLAACLDRADVNPARVFALFTDSYLFFALDMPAMSPPRDITGQPLRDRLAALPRPPFGMGNPRIEGVWVLPQSEASAIVRSRAEPESAYYLILSATDGGWLIDQFVRYPFPVGFVPPIGTPPPIAESPLEVAAVTMFDILYVPDEVTIPADTLVTLALTNAGVADHSFVIDALGINEQLRPGETKTITLRASAGTYEYFSDIPGQRDAGMVGKMTVVSEDVPTLATPVS